MKKLAAILVCLTLVLTAAVSCGQSPNSDTYTPGTISEKGYSSDWLGIEFIPSDDLVMSTSEEIEELLEVSADMFYVDEATGEQLLDWAKVTTVYEMMATDIATGSNVIVMAEKLSLENTTVEQYIEALKTQIDSQLEIGAEYTELCEATIAGETYTRFEYTMELYGTQVRQVMFIRKLGERMVTICVTADGDEVDSFISCFKEK